MNESDNRVLDIAQVDQFRWQTVGLHMLADSIQPGKARANCY